MARHATSTNPDTGQVAVQANASQPVPASPPTAALCVSGGGSRALSAALGQFSGLRAQPDPQGTRASMLERFDYLSSVSGGSWASVLWTYAPETTTDDQLLIAPVAPSALCKKRAGSSTPGNVAHMDSASIGSAPQQFSNWHLAKVLWKMHEWHLFSHPERWHWFWVMAIGEIILKPAGLYGATYDRSKDYPEPDKFFASSADWLNAHVLPYNPDLTGDDFRLMRTGRSPLFVNMNIIKNDAVAKAVQIPVQVSGAAGGARGLSVDGTIGGGLVQSFGFTSQVAGPGAQDGVTVDFERRYSLADIAGCSSAFFAAFIIKYLNQELDSIRDEVEKLTLHLADGAVDHMFASMTDFLDAGAGDLIPTYNYWQPTAAPTPAANATRGFSDGGDFDNTGVLGAIARTDATRLLSLVNSEERLLRHQTSGEVIVPGQLALLFGYKADMTAAGEWESYGGLIPAEPQSYVHVFDDETHNGSGGRFKQLREALFDASADGGSEPWQKPASASQQLTTIENPVAGIRAGRVVDIVWLVNNRVQQWQDAITDQDICADLADGQSVQTPGGTPGPATGGSGPLSNFPWYSTGGQFRLDPEGVNMLAQLSAWNIGQINDDLTTLLS